MTTIRFLSGEDKEAIHSASVDVLENTGILVKNEMALEILKEAGCSVDSDRVRIPSTLIEESIKKPPSSFKLYTRDGSFSHNIGDSNVIYNPGSSVTYFIDSTKGEIRKGTIADLEKIVHLVDAVAFLHAQSTALIPSDIPESTADFYRLYLVLKHSTKPIITGAFRKEGFHDMRRLLEVIAGGPDELSSKPRAIFDCCPSSPLIWSDVTCQNLIDCTTHRIPAEIVPAPLMGATSPVTLDGTIVQTNAEILSGIVISQLVRPGSTILYGGAPAVFDQRYATPRFGAIEAIMTACASAEMGKYYGIPTHAYLGLSDSKVEDAQTGFESGLGIILGAMAGINVVSGPGALAYINMQSLEKIVIDNELCGIAYRLVEGLAMESMSELTDLIHKVGPGGDFLGQRHTASKLRREHFFPSDLIDRLTTDSWLEGGSKDALTRAKERVDLILKDHIPTPLPRETEKELDTTFRELLGVYAPS